MLVYRFTPGLSWFFFYWERCGRCMHIKTIFKHVKFHLVTIYEVSWELMKIKFGICQCYCRDHGHGHGGDGDCCCCCCCWWWWWWFLLSVVVVGWGWRWLLLCLLLFCGSFRMFSNLLNCFRLQSWSPVLVFIGHTVRKKWYFSMMLRRIIWKQWSGKML